MKTCARFSGRVGVAVTLGLLLRSGIAMAVEQRQTPAPTSRVGLPEESGEVDLLSFHRPNYLVSGLTSNTQVKFQFSIKYELWPNRTGHAVYFGYTQKSLWDLWSFDESSPFIESNYNPELFYSFHHVQNGRWGSGCRIVSEQFGIDHESNGESARRSRSWNRMFAALSAACVSNQRRFIAWGPKLWLPFGLKENPRIADYVGYGELEVRYGTIQGDRWYGAGEVAVTGRKGVSQNGSVLVELTWRPGYGSGFARVWRFTPYFYAQYFTGQGETLLTYDRDIRAFRLGIGFRDRALLPN